MASQFSFQDALFDLAGCQHCGLCHYEQTESASLFLNIFMFLTSSELILLHWNNLSSEAPVQLPFFQSEYFLDTSRFQIAPDHQLFVQYILLYTFLSIGKLGLNLPSSFTELFQSLSFNHFLFANCVYRERQRLIFIVTQYCLYYSSLIFLDTA